jgi:hypothetical protein
MKPGLSKTEVECERSTQEADWSFEDVKWKADAWWDCPFVFVCDFGRKLRGVERSKDMIYIFIHRNAKSKEKEAKQAVVFVQAVIEIHVFVSRGEFSLTHTKK